MSRSTLIFALWVFCQDYHSGQWSRGYRLLSRISSRYNPRLSDSAYDDIRDEMCDPNSDWFWESRKYQELVAGYSEKM